MSGAIASLTEARARRLWQAWVDAREAAAASPGVDRWRAAVAAWDAFKAEFDKLGKAR
jgi:hypothetical protein